MLKRRVKLRIRTASRQSLTAGGQHLRVFCAACGQAVETLSRAEACEILEIVDERLAMLISSGRVHAIVTVSGSVRVCKDSLF